MLRTLAWLLILVTFALGPERDAWAGCPTMVITEEWAPFNYTENGKITGFSVEIVSLILEALGQEPSIRMLPGVRGKRLLNSRPRTIMFSMFRTPQRESLYKWAGPLCDGSIFFYKLRDNPKVFRSMADLKQAGTVACRYVGLVPTLLLQHGFKNLDMTATSSLQVYRKLLLGRCDLAISDTNLGVRYHLKRLHAPQDAFKRIPIKIFESQLYIAFSKDFSDRYVRLWQEALDSLKSGPVFEEIENRYK